LNDTTPARAGRREWIALAVLSLPTGTLGDRIGRKKLLLMGPRRSASPPSSPRTQPARRC
jgi:hypothetical protein